MMPVVVYIVVLHQRFVVSLVFLGDAMLAGKKWRRLSCGTMFVNQPLYRRYLKAS